MEYKFMLYLVLAVLLETTCVNQTGTSNSIEGKGDEEEFSLISSAYTLRFGGGKPFDSSSQIIVDYFLQKGFTQVPIDVKFYHLAGLHDSRAGQVEVSNTFKCDGFYAFVKKTELGVGVLVVTIPCPENLYTGCSHYFFSKLEFEITHEKCDKGNSVTYERYLHDEWINGKQLGIQKDVSTIELCFDGKYVGQADVHIR